MGAVGGAAGRVVAAGAGSCLGTAWRSCAEGLGLLEPGLAGQYGAHPVAASGGLGECGCHAQRCRRHAARRRWRCRFAAAFGAWRNRGVWRLPAYPGLREGLGDRSGGPAGRMGRHRTLAGRGARTRMGGRCGRCPAFLVAAGRRDGYDLGGATGELAGWRPWRHCWRGTGSPRRLRRLRGRRERRGRRGFREPCRGDRVRRSCATPVAAGSTARCP